MDSTFEILIEKCKNRRERDVILKFKVVNLAQNSLYNGPFNSHYKALELKCAIKWTVFSTGAIFARNNVYNSCLVLELIQISVSNLYYLYKKCDDSFTFIAHDIPENWTIAIISHRTIKT